MRHILPQIGPIEVSLYSPADKLYEILENNNEIRRLNCLRHLGALTSALPGARLYRWDYTVALLYFSQQLKVPKFKTSIRLGNVNFSSLTAALQCASLLWNIGHLPGTYAAEKGVCRYLINNDNKHPVSDFHWKFSENKEVKNNKACKRVLD